MFEFRLKIMDYYELYVIIGLDVLCYFFYVGSLDVFFLLENFLDVDEVLVVICELEIIEV